MTSTIRGLTTTQALVTHPVQWQLLLLLANGPRTGASLWRDLSWHQRLRCCDGLWRLWHHQLIMFHVKHGVWQLSPLGETLQPVLTAIQTCTQKKGETQNDL